MEELSKAYTPADIEPAMTALWEEAAIFQPTDDPTAKPFTIIAPPPNANGTLHIGHAVGITLQDVMVRYHRMKGEAALWLPGYDHAGFETQVVFDKKLEKEGRNRFQMERHEVYKEMYEFTQASIVTMKHQLRKLGASMDWSRELFTLDPKVVKIVYRTFKTLYDDGLVYRGERPVNWCIKHQTSLAELEVSYEDRVDPLYYIKYGPLTIATVRPESQGGDVAIAVHPDDPRYASYIGNTVSVEMADRVVELPVVADTYVDPEFGTGAVKITPALDPNDYELAKRHNLPVIEIIDKYGKLTDAAGQFAGLKAKEARGQIVSIMESKGLIEKTNDQYHHMVGLCYKCKSLIEPRILPQWFIAMTATGKSGKNLRDDAVTSVKSGAIKFVSKKFENLFYSWMDNLRDWNISHQIVWGIQLPIWYDDNDPDAAPIITDGSDPSELPENKGRNLRRDPDVFNTWFSSGQWPFAALEAQANGVSDLSRFYPTAVMETAYDIIFFWVARMIMLGVYATDKPPFRTVYIHGLVRDKDRQKMSKSKGNVIDPLGIAEQYGSDAVRMTIAFGTAAGNDIVIPEEKIRGMRNFANKLWNINRFIALQLEGRRYRLHDLSALTPMTDADSTIVEQLNGLVPEVSNWLDNQQFHLAAERLYEFIWHEFADNYVEASKAQLADSTGLKDTKDDTSSDTLVDTSIVEALGGPRDVAVADSTRLLLLGAWLKQLALLHPFMPFVTEAIYQTLPIDDKSKTLAGGAWPN